MSVGFIHYFICAYDIVSVKLCNALYDIPPNKSSYLEKPWV